jgi:hypothetical protein
MAGEAMALTLFLPPTGRVLGVKPAPFSSHCGARRKNADSASACGKPRQLAAGWLELHANVVSQGPKAHFSLKSCGGSSRSPIRFPLQSGFQTTEKMPSPGDPRKKT